MEVVVVAVRPQRKEEKKKLNEFFKVMLKAKRAGAASFKYKGKTYKGRKHHRLNGLQKGINLNIYILFEIYI